MIILTDFIRSVYKQFLAYFITGVSAFVLDIGSLYVFKEYLRIDAWEAVVINQVFLIAYVFAINKFWTFRATGQTHRQAVRFLILCFANYAFAVAWMWFFNEKIGLNYLVARTANIALSVAWNFLIYKFWVYKTDRVDNSADPLLTI
jgi:putative flippase GtrA